LAGNSGTLRAISVDVASALGAEVCLQSRREFLKLIGALGASSLAASCGGSSGTSSVPSGQKPPSEQPGSLQSSIKHIVFVMQENRSFDHYFGMMPDYRQRMGIPGGSDIDGLPANASNPSYTLDNQLDSANLVTAFHQTAVKHENLSCTWNETHRNWNFHNPASPNPVLDGFVAIAAIWSRNNIATPGVVDIMGQRAMGYYTDQELPFYYALASQFAMSDRYFCSALTHTQPNRMYLLAGSSYGRITSLKNYPDPTAVDAKTIFDLLTEHGISWKIYIHHRTGNPNAFTYYRSFKSYARNGGLNNPNIVDGSEFATDATNGTLPQVAMIEVTGGLDEHPGNNIQQGSSVVRSYFMDLLHSPSWASSAMMLTFDEHGGLYDHVIPPAAVPPDDIAPMYLSPTDVQAGFDRYGFRVPFVMVSPWAKKNFVSHTVADHTSILKFIETRFGLPSLTRRDAAAHDLQDMFDFSAMSWPKPPDLPDQPITGSTTSSIRFVDGDHI
jgi:phospholipase C